MPTGYRRFGSDARRWVRLAGIHRVRHTGYVYSLEVPRSHKVAVSSGLLSSNCFPKDVDALKQLAGNSGYHFQLLTAVIEVNELQKRRVIQKLHKHLGGLVGKHVALLGLAFWSLISSSWGNSADNAWSAADRWLLYATGLAVLLWWTSPGTNRAAQGAKGDGDPMSKKLPFIPASATK